MGSSWYALASAVISVQNTGTSTVASGTVTSRTSAPASISMPAIRCTTAATSGATRSKKWLTGMPTVSPRTSAVGTGTGELIAPSTCAASATVRVIGPTVSSDHDKGVTPRRETLPYV